MNNPNKEIKLPLTKEDPIPHYYVEWEEPEYNTDDYTWMGNDYIILPDNWENDD